MADLTVEGVGNLKVNDLKKELKARSLSIAGTKSELSARLLDFLGKGAQLRLGDRSGADENLTQEDEELLNDPVEDVQPKGSAAVAASAGAGEPGLTAVETPASQAKLQPEAAAAIAGGSAKKAVADVKSMSAEERLKLRQQKFNVVAADDKKEARAKRFGLPQAASVGAAATADVSPAKVSTAGAAAGSAPTLAASLEKLKQRRERFGQAVSDTIKKVEETERILKRKQRFGAVAPAAVTADVEEKKKKRAERFGAKVA